MLRLDLRPGEGVDIENGRIVIRLEQKPSHFGNSTELPSQRLGRRLL